MPISNYENTITTELFEFRIIFMANYHSGHPSLTDPAAVYSSSPLDPFQTAVDPPVRFVTNFDIPRVHSHI